jgi:hypothetical protein
MGSGNGVMPDERGAELSVHRYVAAGMSAEQADLVTARQETEGLFADHPSGAAGFLEW